MNNQVKKVDVSSIVFTSNDTEVLLKGRVRRGQLSYDTDLVITQTQLNMVMNSLRKQNESMAIDDCLRSEIIGQNETLFYADFGHLTNAKIDIRSIMKVKEIVQIRA
jgi:hypothetical protein